MLNIIIIVSSSLDSSCADMFDDLKLLFIKCLCWNWRGQNKTKAKSFFRNKMTMGYHRTKRTVCYVSTTIYIENNLFWWQSGSFVLEKNNSKLTIFVLCYPKIKLLKKMKNDLALFLFWPLQLKNSLVNSLSASLLLNIFLSFEVGIAHAIANFKWKENTSSLKN